MKVFLKPLYSQLNPGISNCPLGCEQVCQVHQQAPNLQPPPGYTCPLSIHQAQTCAEVVHGTTDVIFNKAATGDGKSLAAYAPGLINPHFRIMGLYPTIELVEDQTRSQQGWHSLFGLDAEERIDRLFGEELSRRVQQAENSNKFQELLLAIQHKPILLTNPDIFHLITHFQYRHPAYGNDLLPFALADFPDLWVFDEFHIFGPHQEAAVLNSMTLIRRAQSDQRPRRFLFTSATPKPDFINQLQQSGLKAVEISGNYASETTPGYRQVLQPVELEFVALKDADSLDWLTENVDRLTALLQIESHGRGLVILNSVAQAGRAARLLQRLLPGVLVREISGRIDRRERSQTQLALKNATQPVLVIGTSAVDVGVDFKIHLLIFESSDSATVIQRLGRLGRHPGFSAYKAFVLLSGRTPWVIARLQEHLEPEQSVERSQLQEAIAEAFDAPKEFQEYRNRWGAIQAQGMLWKMGEGNAKVMQPVRDRMVADLQKVYGSKLKPWLNDWKDLAKSDIGKATQQELLRFRGGSTLQAAVWDGSHFYTYDLLRLLPYALVETTTREAFLDAATSAGLGAEAFPQDHTQIYLRVQEWVDDRFDVSLHCNWNSSDLKCCELTLLSRLSLVGHPQSEVGKCLYQKKLLAFLVPLGIRQLHWEVSRHLKLSPVFGLHYLTDGSNKQGYACAFNQDALLLAALHGRLTKFCRLQPQSLIF
ncbi:type I-D CRISPR-associated helicase Cas3' (plasmid) [Kovacikia minuta CCNUW1]|uniref:type I-D CRISPR-associated helicase Cas3' n=1 Tax=Kovacikia minuta TaxID=2931930 RepID=UPI001CCC114F|nr:type I-D CRISPR-associated helicase Cas3' [Kovacikia minuta]UBF30155.1 type I-D CRISPR-associated helicase Cas3' [Kovacikia minuta CCNUW1]